MCSSRKKILIYVCGAMIALAMFLVNEILYQIMIYFKNDSVTVFINFVRYVGAFFALVVLSNCTPIFAQWVEWKFFKNKNDC